MSTHLDNMEKRDLRLTNYIFQAKQETLNMREQADRNSKNFDECT